MNRIFARLVCFSALAVLLFASNLPAQQNAPAKKKILFIAGNPSHGYAQHEHNAGCTLLANCLNESGLPVEAVVAKNGWPKDPSMFDGVSAVVMYCDGGEGHVAMKHLDELEELAKKGVGIGCIHYGVEVPKGPAGNDFVNWIGGYFETDWSVNPEWKADFKELPRHEVTRGVKPFTIFDEWYFHMRFPENMKGVTPILTAVPPSSTMSRKDGPHEGNPTVRDEVARGFSANHVLGSPAPRRRPRLRLQRRPLPSQLGQRQRPQADAQHAVLDRQSRCSRRRRAFENPNRGRPHLQPRHDPRQRSAGEF